MEYAELYIMPKEKKINVTPYLNTKLKPLFDEKDRATYPIYFRVSYDRKNTQFAIDEANYMFHHREDFGEHNVGFLYVNEDEFEELYPKVKNDIQPEMSIENGVYMVYGIDSVVATLIALKKIIKSIVKFELKRNVFQFSGFGKRLNEKYLGNIVFDFGLFLSDKLLIELEGKIDKVMKNKIQNQKTYFYKKIDAINSRNLISKVSKELYNLIESYFLIAIYADTELSAYHGYYWLIDDRKSNFIPFHEKKEVEDDFYVKYINLFKYDKKADFYLNLFMDFLYSNLEG